MRYLSSILLAALAAGPAGADPPPDTAGTSEGPGPVIRISVEVIQLDVVVTDKRGRYVTDLGPADFEIRQDGRVQPVSHATYVRAGEPWQDPTAPPDASSPGTTAPPAPPRTLVLVYDDLGMSLDSAVRARRAFLTLVDGLLPTDRAAIVSTSSWDGALLLSSHRQELHAAASKLRYVPYSRQEVDLPWARGSSASLGAPPYALLGELDWNHRMALRSLGATTRVIEELQAVEGRKAVILVSEGFPGLTSIDNPYLWPRHWPVEFADLSGGDVLEMLRRLGDFAARASVVVHTLDPRGLMTTGLGAAAASGPPTGGPNVLARSSYAMRESQASLQHLPRETGGLAILDSNDLAGGARRVLEDMAGYYLVGYVPSDSTFEGDRPDFHDIDVEVKRKGVKVRTRRGFYGVADEDLVP